MNISEVESILETAEQVRSNKNSGEYQALIEIYNAFIEKEQLNQEKVIYNESTDVIWMGSEISQDGPRKVLHIINVLKSIIRENEPKAQLKATTIPATTKTKKIIIILAKIGFSGGILVFLLGLMYNLGQASQIRKYDEEKFRIKSSLDSITKICDSLRNQNMILKREK